MTIYQELDISVKKYRKLAKINYAIAFFIYLIAVISSILATLLALTSFANGAVLALITALPGALLLLSATFNFSERANWHYEKKNQLNALRRLVLTQAEGSAPGEVAVKWNAIDAAMEASWPKFNGLAGKIKQK